LYKKKDVVYLPDFKITHFKNEKDFPTFQTQKKKQTRLSWENGIC